MKYLLILLLSSCSYSLHEHNLTTQRKTMLKYDKQSKKVQQKIRSEKQVKKKLVKRRKRIIVY
jgi:hypothetical protein